MTSRRTEGQTMETSYLSDYYHILIGLVGLVSNNNFFNLPTIKSGICTLGSLKDKTEY